MATGSTRDVKMVLSVESLGQENITKLQQALRDLAATGGAGTAEFAELADQIGRLGDQGAALQAFKTLTAETDALREKQESAGAEVERLAARLDTARLAADQLKAAQAAARADMVAGEKAYIDAGNALRLLKAEYRAGKVSTDAYNAGLITLTQNQNEARATLVGLKEANRQANIEVTAAVQAQKKATTAYAGAAKQYDAAGRAVEKQVIALKQAGDAASELSVDVTDLARAEADLLSTFSRGTTALTSRRQAVEEMAEADRLAAIEARGLADVYKRGEAALQAETQAQRDAEKATQAYTAAKNKATADAAAWQREADEIVAMAEAQRRTRAETERLVESLNELNSVNAFEKQAREAQKMVQAAEYVRFWEQALDDADRKQQELATGANKLNAAFQQIDNRSIEQVKVEIDQTTAAMRDLAESGRLTGGALAVAMERGQQKINALQREARELSGSLTLADRAAGLLKNSLGQIAIGNIIADGVGYLVEKVKELGRAFIEVALQTESTRKALTAIYKDTGTAATQMQFLRSTASAAGVSISGITDDFVRFSAAAKGSNIPIEQSNALFQSLTRAASTLGLGAEKTGLALNALGQIASKGVVSMEELRQQLGDAVPGALSLTAKGLGITEAELIKLVESGQLAARDFFPAFTEGLKTMQGEVDGARQGWERFKNVLTLVAIGAEANGAMQLLTAGLKLVGGIVGAVAFGVNSLIEALMLFRRTAALVAETLKGNGTEAWASYRAEAEKTTLRVKEQGLALLALVNPSEENLALLEKLAAKNREMSGGVAAATATLTVNTKELAANAKQAALSEAGALALAKANQVTQSTTLGVTEQWVKLNVEMVKLAAQQTANVVVSEKLAKAAELEGVAAVRLATLKGDEVGILQATAEAATRNSDAISRAAVAREAEAAVLRVQANEMAKLAVLQDGSTEKRTAEIKAITDKVEKLDAEAQAARNAAEASRIESKERELSVKLYEDNSAAVDKLNKARTEAAVNLEYANDLEALGLRTKADVIAATEELATATRLYDDALKDSITSLDLSTRAKTADLSVTDAKASAEQRLYERLAASSKAQGDNAMAVYYTIEAKQREIKQIELSVQIKNLEIAADRQAIEIQKQALDAAEPLYQQKVKELDIRLQLLKVQEIENKSKLDAINAIQKEIENLRLYGDVKSGTTDHTRNDTSATNENTDAKLRNAKATEAQTAAENARGGGKYSSPLGSDKYARPAGGSTTGNTREERLAGQAASDETMRFELLQKLRAGTLTQADLPALKALVSSLKTNQAVFDSMPIGLSSLSGLADDKKWANARTGFEQAISNMGGGEGAKVGTNVTVNIGGQRRNIGVASQADANTLVSVLRDLENQSGTSV